MYFVFLFHIQFKMLTTHIYKHHAVKIENNIYLSGKMYFIFLGVNRYQIIIHTILNMIRIYS